jgi:2-aminoadipate transaminase
VEKFHFVGGQTCPESVPVQGLIKAAKQVLTRRGKQLVSYPSQINQHDELIQVAAHRFEHVHGISLPLENIIITTGSMQAISLMVDILTHPGDTIITEELTYMGSLECFRHFQLNIVGIPVDVIDGMDIDALQDTLKGLASKNIKPRFIYTIVNYQNPTGAILSLERRERMLELAQEYSVVILEDDCYGGVDFEPDSIPQSLFALGDQGSVTYIASFSKIFGPGIRLGYLCTPDRFVKQIHEMKRYLDAGTSALASFIVAEYLRDNLWSHVAKHNAIIKEKRDVILEALRIHLSDYATWNKPRGGLFLWVELPEAVDMQKLEELSDQCGVRYDPGKSFHVRSKELKYLRLSYAHMTQDEIRQGIALLAKCIKKCVP